MRCRGMDTGRPQQQGLTWRSRMSLGSSKPSGSGRGHRFRCAGRHLLLGWLHEVSHRFSMDSWSPWSSSMVVRSASKYRPLGSKRRLTLWMLPAVLTACSWRKLRQQISAQMVSIAYRLYGLLAGYSNLRSSAGLWSAGDACVWTLLAALLAACSQSAA